MDYLPSLSNSTPPDHSAITVGCVDLLFKNLGNRFLSRPSSLLFIMSCFFVSQSISEVLAKQKCELSKLVSELIIWKPSNKSFLLQPVIFTLLH